MADAKACTRCGVVKPVAEFSRHKRAPLGVTSRCRLCTRLWHQEDRKRRPEVYKARGRAYRTSPGGRKASAAKAKRYRERHPERHRENLIRYGKRNPDKVMARMTVWWAVNTGRLPLISTLTCTDCGAQAQERDHHLGYDQAHWLHTQPVCKRCHGIRRRVVR